MPAPSTSCRRSESVIVDQPAAAVAAVEQLPRAMNEIWNLGPQAPSGGWRAPTGDGVETLTWALKCVLSEE